EGARVGRPRERKLRVGGEVGEGVGARGGGAVVVQVERLRAAVGARVVDGEGAAAGVLGPARVDGGFLEAVADLEAAGTQRRRAGEIGAGRRREIRERRAGEVDAGEVGGGGGEVGPVAIAPAEAAGAAVEVVGAGASEGGAV